MSPLTRNWLMATLFGWALLAYGWFADSTWSIGGAVLIFLVLLVERLDNMPRGRR